MLPILHDNKYFLKRTFFKISLETQYKLIDCSSVCLSVCGASDSYCMNVSITLISFVFIRFLGNMIHWVRGLECLNKGSRPIHIPLRKGILEKQG